MDYKKIAAIAGAAVVLPFALSRAARNSKFKVRVEREILRPNEVEDVSVDVKEISVGTFPSTFALRVQLDKGFLGFYGRDDAAIKAQIIDEFEVNDIDCTPYNAEVTQLISKNNQITGFIIKFKNTRINGRRTTVEFELPVGANANDTGDITASFIIDGIGDVDSVVARVR